MYVLRSLSKVMAIAGTLSVTACGAQTPGPGSKGVDSSPDDGAGDTAGRDDTAVAVDEDGDGWAAMEDCDDADPSIHPTAEEVCNDLDDDCDGAVDDDDLDLVEQGWVDCDGDGFPGTWAPTCDGAMESLDCDDTDAAVHPGAEELLCDGVDNDCDGTGAGAAAVLAGVEFSTVGDALGVAVDGDTIQVCPGTHVVHLEVPTGLGLVLESWSGDAADTLLDGAHAGTILFLEYGARVVVRNLSFVRGQGEDWGGVGGESGGGVVVIGGELDIEDCVFSDNASAYQGGAVAVFSERSGDLPGEARLGVSGTRFEDNHAGYSGGAMELAAPAGVVAATLSDSTFERNEALYDGGGAQGIGELSQRGLPRCLRRGVQRQPRPE